MVDLLDILKSFKPLKEKFHIKTNEIDKEPEKQKTIQQIFQKLSKKE